MKKYMELTQEQFEKIEMDIIKKKEDQIRTILGINNSIKISITTTKVGTTEKLLFNPKPLEVYQSFSEEDGDCYYIILEPLSKDGDFDMAKCYAIDIII